jgi:hypothetical protein
LARTTVPLFENIIDETNGAILTNPYDGGTAMSFPQRLEDIILIARLNNSNAADKLEAILPILKREDEIYEAHAIKRYKKTKGRYEKGGLLEKWESFKLDHRGTVEFLQGHADDYRVLRTVKRENKFKKG